MADEILSQASSERQSKQKLISHLLERNDEIADSLLDEKNKQLNGSIKVAHTN